MRVVLIFLLMFSFRLQSTAVVESFSVTRRRSTSYFQSRTPKIRLHHLILRNSNIFTGAVMSAPTDMEFWPPRAEQRVFDWSKPTCDVYRVGDTHLFSEPFRESRSKLDYSYHKNPMFDRQLYQDMVLARILEADSEEDDDDVKDDEDSTPSAVESPRALKTHQRPFLVFMSGPMGVGKSYVLSQLHQKGIFPLQKFVKIDPDMLKSELPEMAGYLQHDSDSAATKLHRESTQMSDVLFEHSLMKHRNVLVDGSLRDTDWYQTLFERIRKEFPHYLLCILYVSASTETIKDRAHQRAAMTDRTVPDDLLQESIEQVPRSVETLSPLTDYTFEITNDDGQPMTLRQWPSKNHGRKEDGGDDDNNNNNNDNRKSEPSWKEFGQIWQRPSKGEKEGKEERFFCHMMEHLSCPIQSEKEFESAKNIWGKAYPSFCPRCTLSSDHQCACGSQSLRVVFVVLFHKAFLNQTFACSFSFSLPTNRWCLHSWTPQMLL